RNRTGPQRHQDGFSDGWFLKQGGVTVEAELLEGHEQTTVVERVDDDHEDRQKQEDEHDNGPGRHQAVSPVARFHAGTSSSLRLHARRTGSVMSHSSAPSTTIE